MAAPEPIIDASPFDSRPGVTAGSRMLRLLNAADREIRLEFLRLIGKARGVFTLEQMATLFEQGRIDEALVMMDAIGEEFFNAINAAYITAGRSTAVLIGRSLNELVQFDTTSDLAVSVMRRNKARLVTGLTDSAREAMVTAINEGLTAGLRTDQIARAMRGSIGLTSQQVEAVAAYRRSLEARDGRALQRTLRDRRFDSTVRRSVRDDVPLTQKQINRMVDRYSQRQLAHRSNVIARTEALRAVNEGDETMWQQAVDNGTVDADDISTTWITASDERVRSSHSFMNGQQSDFGEPFRSGNGNSLRFPGDPRAPGSDTINCRCVLSRTIPRRDP